MGEGEIGENLGKWDNIRDDVECVECTFNCGESIYHKNDPLQKCSHCDFETKCEADYDEHWASTNVGHFPSENKNRQSQYQIGPQK